MIGLADNVFFFFLILWGIVAFNAVLYFVCKAIDEIEDKK